MPSSQETPEVIRVEYKVSHECQGDLPPCIREDGKSPSNCSALKHLTRKPIGEVPVPKNKRTDTWIFEPEACLKLRQSRRCPFGKTGV